MRHSKRISAALSLLAAAPALAATLQVHPGQSIQAAVDRAQAGDTLEVFPGTYHEAGRPCPTDSSQRCAVAVTKNDIQLVGLEEPGHPVVLATSAGQDQGIAFGKPNASGPVCLSTASQRIQGAAVRGFTVNGFSSVGLSLFCVDHFTIQDSSANGNGEYGIFPSHSGFGRITDNTATGSNDTGIYVGQSHDVRVDHNTATGNVSGFEIENSTRVELDHNLATGNTGGILSFTLPFLDVNSNHDNSIHDNTAVLNNKRNTCLHPTDDVCGVPEGTGILLLAVQRNEVRNNAALGNNSFGIALSDTCTANQLPLQVCQALGIDPFPNGNEIEENVALGNGQSPDPVRLPPGSQGGDLIWTGLGHRNCWSENVSLINISPILPLPACD